MQIVSKGKIIELNEGQENAIIQTSNFLKGNDSFQVIEGSAGTGKTTILKECINRYRGKALITAPTHKAKRIASAMTGMDSTTIHSFLGLRPDVDLENFDHRNVLFSRKKGGIKLHNIDLLCVDESSMLNKSLLFFIKKECLDLGIKAIFLGDRNQLLPVDKENNDLIKKAPVFIDEEIKNVSLTKVQRQLYDNPLMETYDSIIKNIDSKQDLFKRETKILGNSGIIFMENQVREFGKKALDLFSSSDYKENIDFCKLLAFQNNTVKKWNNYIRKNIWGEGLISSPIRVGEMLMAYNSIFCNTKGLPLIENSSEYLVLDVESKFKEKMFGYEMIIENIDTLIQSKVFILDREYYEEFKNKSEMLANIAKNKENEKNRGYYWSEFYSYRNKFQLIENICDINGAVVVKKDFDFAYALTVHKSQGSTYANVLIEEGDINSCYDDSTRNRLKYVALTRPTNMAYLNC